jgi:PAS domain S-box-containing protein
MPNKEKKELPRSVRRTRPDGRLRDVNEQLTLAALHSQEQADESAGRYRDLVEGLDAVVLEADAGTWQFTFISPGAQRLLGYPVERWLREPSFWVDLIHPEDRKATVNACKTAAAGAEIFRIEFRAIARDGHTVWLALIARVRQRDQGPARQVQGLLLDIGESKRAEELERVVSALKASEAELQTKNDELEKFHDMIVGRELKLVELKKQVTRLQGKIDELTSERNAR